MAGLLQDRSVRYVSVDTYLRWDLVGLGGPTAILDRINGIDVRAGRAAFVLVVAGTGFEPV
jgi:hypothetical protein